MAKTRSNADAKVGSPCSSVAKMLPPPSLATTILRSARFVGANHQSCDVVQERQVTHQRVSGTSGAQRDTHRAGERAVDAGQAPVGRTIGGRGGDRSQTRSRMGLEDPATSVSSSVS